MKWPRVLALLILERLNGKIGKLGIKKDVILEFIIKTIDVC